MLPSIGILVVAIAIVGRLDPVFLIRRRYRLSSSSTASTTSGPMMRWIKIRRNCRSSSIDCETIAIVIFRMLIILFGFIISRNTAR